MSDGDYVLGTRTEEIERLGLQHRVWRHRMLDAFRRAGISQGQHVVDVGAGPGFGTTDLADLVGPSGRVFALERATSFIEVIRQRGASNVEVHQHDVTRPFPTSANAASWCRWLLSFVTDPRSVVENIADALRPTGAAIFHEYGSYSTWRMLPPSPLQDRFRSMVMQSWRDSGGEPDVGLALPSLLQSAGLEIQSVQTYCDIVSPSDLIWQWPQAFMAVNAERLRDLGYIDQDEAAAMAVLLENAPAGMMMMTPLVVEVIARKPVLRRGSAETQSRMSCDLAGGFVI